jgi:hypothetical protein
LFVTLPHYWRSIGWWCSLHRRRRRYPPAVRRGTWQRWRRCGSRTLRTLRQSGKQHEILNKQNQPLGSSLVYVCLCLCVSECFVVCRASHTLHARVSNFFVLFVFFLFFFFFASCSTLQLSHLFVLANIHFHPRTFQCSCGLFVVGSQIRKRPVKATVAVHPTDRRDYCHVLLSPFACFTTYH